LVAWQDAVLRPLADSYVKSLAPVGHADLIELALDYPVRAVYQIIGFDDELDPYETFHSGALAMLLAQTADTDASKAERSQHNLERAIRAAQEIWDGIVPVVARKRAEGATGNDLISHLIRAELDGRPLSDDQITGFVKSLLGAATENTTRQFLNTFTLLLQRPDELARVRVDPDYLQAAVLEGERFEGPAMVLPRITTHEVEISGTTIPADTAVLLAIGSANHDEEVFAPDPEEFRIGRAGPPSLSFGWGVHVCPGMNTTRKEITALLDAIFEHLPNARLDADGPEPVILGVQQRGPATLRIVWDPT
jgi:cytochrome P450